MTTGEISNTTEIVKGIKDLKATLQAEDVKLVENEEN